jgi:hypothetical protein
MTPIGEPFPPSPVPSPTPVPSPAPDDIATNR